MHRLKTINAILAIISCQQAASISRTVHIYLQYAAMICIMNKCERNDSIIQGTHATGPGKRLETLRGNDSTRFRSRDHKVVKRNADKFVGR